jgi:hypothetical protein
MLHLIPNCYWILCLSCIKYTNLIFEGLELSTFGHFLRISSQTKTQLTLLNDSWSLSFIQNVVRYKILKVLNAVRTFKIMLRALPMKWPVFEHMYLPLETSQLGPHTALFAPALRNFPARKLILHYLHLPLETSQLGNSYCTICTCP